MPYKDKNYSSRPRKQDGFRKIPYKKPQHERVTPPPAQPSMAPPTQSNIVPPAQSNTAPPAQSHMTSVMQEVAEMKSILNQLLLTRPQPPIQQPPQLHTNNQHCTPLGQQHPSLMQANAAAAPPTNVNKPNPGQMQTNAGSSHTHC